MAMIKGIGLLILFLIAFSLFSFKAPKGMKAMGGMAEAAVAAFLVEAVHKYVSGDLLNLSFLGEVGAASGSMGGVAAAILVPLSMGVNPTYAVVAGVAVAGYGILPGFIAGYFVGLFGEKLKEKLPLGFDIIVGALLIAPFARFIAFGVDPFVTAALQYVGAAVTVAASQSPILMGFILGGVICVIGTSPLSSMALTAMLGLDGLAMGIAAIACVGAAFTNGMTVKNLKLGDKSNVIGIMLEPLTQADIVTSNALPIYGVGFFGGAVAGVGAAILGIINNAPGTASVIPGLLAPFGFNPPLKVIAAIIFAAIGGTVVGMIGSSLLKKYRTNPNLE